MNQYSTVQVKYSSVIYYEVLYRGALLYQVTHSSIGSSSRCSEEMQLLLSTLENSRESERHTASSSASCLVYR